MTEKEFKQVVEYVQYALRIQNEKSVGIGDCQELIDVITNIDNIHNALTEEGFKIYAKKKAKKEKEQFVEDPVFRQFYDLYPTNNKFSWKGMDFIPDKLRGFRGDFAKCQNKFQQLCKTWNFSPESVIEGLRYDLIARRDKSVKTGKNELDYMPLMETWLNQERHWGLYLLKKKDYEHVSVRTKTVDVTDMF